MTYNLANIVSNQRKLCRFPFSFAEKTSKKSRSKTKDVCDSTVLSESLQKLQAIGSPIWLNKHLIN